MNLATRCPRCATTFKLQEAQLVASEGQVRCGRCDTVFDARESLFDLDTGDALHVAPADEAGPPPGVTAEPTFDEPAAEGFAGDWQADAPSSAAAAARPALAPPPPDRSWTAPAATGPGEGGVTPSGIDDRREPAWDDAQDDAQPDGPEAVAVAEAEPAAMAALNHRMNALLGPAGAASTGSAETTTATATGAGNLDAWSSLRDSDADLGPARSWRGVGAWLLLAVLAVALPAQWAWSERAALRAKSPGLDAAMTRLCPGCNNAPWQHLEGLSVSASSLQPTPQGGAYRLSVTLQNRAAHTLALPWVELRLSDGSGKPVLRRAVAPAELGLSTDRLAAGSTVQMGGTFRLPAGTAISGYEIGLFHP